MDTWAGRAQRYDKNNLVLALVTSLHQDETVCHVNVYLLFTVIKLTMIHQANHNSLHIPYCPFMHIATIFTISKCINCVHTITFRATQSTYYRYLHVNVLEFIIQVKQFL